MSTLMFLTMLRLLTNDQEITIYHVLFHLLLFQFVLISRTHNKQHVILHFISPFEQHNIVFEYALQDLLHASQYNFTDSIFSYSIVVIISA